MNILLGINIFLVINNSSSRVPGFLCAILPLILGADPPAPVIQAVTEVEAARGDVTASVAAQSSPPPGS